jgi:erythromycin esterase-like protein
MAYSVALSKRVVTSQENNVVKALTDILSKELVYTAQAYDGDAFFSASENAHVVRSAESYYRQSFLGGAATWNIRDRSMCDTLLHALDFLQRRKQRLLGPEAARPARVVVWAHNSHVGDANATQMSERKECNLGSLARERLGRENCFIVGFSTFQGTVRAAHTWGGSSFQIDLTPALSESHEALLHSVAEQQKLEAFGLVLRQRAKPSRDSGDEPTAAQIVAQKALSKRRLERFVGVQYVRRTERHSHYSFCNMTDQFDAVIHIDTTSALRPIVEAAKPSVRPGTIDYSAWDRFASDIDDFDNDDTAGGTS